MEKSHVVSIVVIIIIFQCTSSVEIPSDFSQYCPYTKLCTQDARLIFNATNKSPCCHPCSCSSSCDRIGKCCPDVADATHESKPYPCRNQTQIFQSYLKRPAWMSGHWARYVVIDECPIKALYLPELAESVAICHNATGIEDMIFVTGVHSDLTYLNKHCAICNREDLYTEWKLYLLDTFMLLLGLSGAEIERHILSMGGVMVVPPTIEIGLKARCGIVPISTCNYTNNWDVYDKELETKCIEQSAENMSVIYKHNNLTFANVYCFLCNYPSDTSVPLECPWNSMERSNNNKHLSAPAKHFSALLVPSVATNSKTECAPGEIIDPFRRVCTSLFCPIGTFPQDGDCITAVKDLRGFAVHLQMEVSFDDYEGQTIIDHELFKDDIATVVMENINKDHMKCGICDSSFVFGNSSSGVMFARIHMVTNESCNCVDLLEGIGKFIAYAPVKVYLSKTQLHVTLINSAEYIESGHKGIPDECNPEDIMFSNEVVFCPSIRVRVDAPNFKGNEHIKTRILSNSVDVGSGTVRICLKDYISILKSTGLLSVSNHLAGNMFVLVLTACLFQVINDIRY